MELVTLFRALAHPVRWRIVNLLMNRPLRWNEIYVKLKREGYVTSPMHLNFHLDTLVKAHVILKKKEEKEVIYTLNPEVAEFVGQLLKSKTKIPLRGA